MADDARPSGVDSADSATNVPVLETANVGVLARRLIVWAAVVGAASFTVLGAWPIVFAYLNGEPWVSDTIRQHFAASIGLPAGAALSFLIVITFEARFESIEMELFGIVKFKGAAGPIRPLGILLSYHCWRHTPTVVTRRCLLAVGP